MSGFALLAYNPGNVGDTIQSIAAQRFLPRISTFVNREMLDQYNGSPSCLILNGWFCHSPERWPPSELLETFITSFHLTLEAARGDCGLLQGENLAYFKAREPIGCRDGHTLNLFRSVGIKAFFSGCLTLTIGEYIGVRGNYAVAVDVDEPVLVQLCRDFKGPVHTATHWSFIRDSRERHTHAEALLALYRAARIVITSRLHCALPCLAMGTPVILIIKDILDPRFEGLQQFFHIRESADVIQNGLRYDVNNPPDNPDLYVSFKKQLLLDVTSFVNLRL